MKSKRSQSKKVEAPIVEAPVVEKPVVEEKMPEVEEEVEEEDEEDENGEVPEVKEKQIEEKRATSMLESDKAKMQKQREAEVEILHNDGVFRVEVLYQLTELNKNFYLFNMQLQKLLGEEK